MPDDRAPNGSEGPSLPDKKLDSWKEIAAHLGRDQRTVQRWEKTEGMPVRRHKHPKKSTVYAYASEIDAWFKERQPKDDPAADAAFVLEPEVADTEEETDTEAVVSATQENEKRAAPAPVEPAVAVKGSVPEPKPYWRVAAIVVVVLSIAMYVTYRVISAWKQTETKVRLVVLPFTNLSGDSKEDYISAGLTDELITQLGRLDPQHLGVVSSTSSKAVAGKPISEISRILNVQYVMEGSVRGAGNQVVIDVKLIQVSDETHVWTNTFKQDLSDVLQVESSVAESVARQMVKSLPVSSALAPAASQPGATVTPDNITKSRDAYLQGKYAWGSRRDPQSGISFFQKAIDLDPSYAQAYAGLASAITVVGQVPNDGMLPGDAKPKARQAAQRALKLDPRLAEAHAVLGNVAMSYDWDLPTAERELKTAIDLNPSDPTAHQWYSYVLILQGRTEEALAESSHMLELEPATPLFHAVREEILCYAHKYDEAIEEGLSSIKVTPEFYPLYYWLGYAYREKKMYPDAIATFTRARQISAERPYLIMAYGHTQALAGNVAEARKALRTLEQLQRTRFVPDMYLAAIHVGLGEKGEAFRLLDSAYRQRIDRLVYLKVEPLADPLRSDPRFQQLLNKIGLH